MKKVSIIVPVYNCADSIPVCVESVLAQTYDNLDILLIDDGSKDCSYDICVDFKEKDSRIRVFHHENHGVSYTRNAGINNSLGDYIMFVDADDVILPDMVERYISAAEQGNIDIVIGGILYKNENDISEKLPPKNITSPGTAIDYIVQGYRGIFGYVPNKMYKRDLLITKNIRFQENISNQEDLMFFLDAVDVAERIKTLQYAGYIYDISGGEKKAGFDVLISNQIHLINIACKYHNIDINPVKKRIGRMLVEGLTNSKSELSIALIKKYLSIEGIIKCLDPTVMEGMNNKIIIWMAKHRMYYPLYLYAHIR